MSTWIIEKALLVALAALQAVAPGLLEKAGKLLVQLAPRGVREVLARELEKLGDTAIDLVHRALELVGCSGSSVGKEVAEVAKEYADKLHEMARKLRDETPGILEIATHDLEKTALTYLVDEKSMKGWVEEVEQKVENVAVLLKKHAAELKNSEARDNKIIMDPTVKVGAWGGDGGDEPILVEGLLTKITVVSTKDCVYSIQFTYLDNSNIEQQSTKYGRYTRKDAESTPININDGEKITKISGTVGSHDSCIVITSLCITIGNNDHPFGKQIGTHFSLPVTSGRVSGFFGWSGMFIDSLGVILSPNY